MRLPEPVDIVTVQARARDAGVVFASGSVFFAARSGEALTAPHMRLNCAKAAELDLERGVEILGKIVSAHA